jgi:hypothetical protein
MKKVMEIMKIRQIRSKKIDSRFLISKEKTKGINNEEGD